LAAVSYRKVLWSLSASADDWLDWETLTRLSMVPIAGLLVLIGTSAPLRHGGPHSPDRFVVWAAEQKRKRGQNPVNRHLYRKTRLPGSFREISRPDRGSDVTRHYSCGPRPNSPGLGSSFGCVGFRIGTQCRGSSGRSLLFILSPCEGQAGGPVIEPFPGDPHRSSNGHCSWRSRVPACAKMILGVGAW